MYFYSNPIHNFPCGAPFIEGHKLLQMVQNETKELGAKYIIANVIKVEGKCPEFQIWAESPNGVKEYKAKTLLFATGTARKHPRVDGEWRKWLPYAGKNNISFYCVNCEAPETSSKNVLIVNSGTVGSALHTARSIYRFTQQIRIFMTEDSYIPFTETDKQILNQSEFEWSSGIIERINIEVPGQLESLFTTDGRRLDCQHFFVSYVAIPRSDLAAHLGVTRTLSDCIITDHRGRTNVDGVWAAGDVRAITQQVAMAVGTGNYAGVMINQFLVSDGPDVQVDPTDLRLGPRL